MNRASPPLVVVALCALAFAACGGNAKSPTPPEPTSPPSPTSAAEQALARHVESTLSKPFLEDCSKANAATDSGKICAVFRGERGNLRAYVIGATFSEGTGWVILQQQGEQWNVVYTQQLTPDNAGVPGVPWPLAPGTEVVIVGTGSCLNVRDGPGLRSRAVDCIRDGTRIKVSSGPAPGDNMQWWQVEGRSGWVTADYLRYPDAAQ